MWPASCFQILLISCPHPDDAELFLVLRLLRVGVKTVCYLLARTIACHKRLACSGRLLRVPLQGTAIAA